MLPHAELLRDSVDPAVLERLITAAEQALRTWELVWTGFVTAEVREEAEQRLGRMSELTITSCGGFPAAERRMLSLERTGLAGSGETDPPSAPLMGLEISGNFLFDPSTPEEFLASLRAAGAETEEIGDLWLRGDRGAQAIVSEPLARRLNGSTQQVRTVPTLLEVRGIGQLQVPPSRQPRRFHSVEASLRIDAVASAGFSVSRSRMAELIRTGSVRINWKPVTSPSRELAPGDRVQLQGKGELLIDTVDRTKRERFRIGMERR